MKTTATYITLMSILAIPHCLALSPIKMAEDSRDSIAIAKLVSLKSKTSSEEIAVAFGRIQKPESAPPLLQILREGTPVAQKNALFALGQLGWDSSFSGSHRESVLQKLKETFLETSRDPLLREEAMRAYSKFGEPGTEALLFPLTQEGNESLFREAFLGYFRSRYSLKMQNPKAVIPPVSDPWIDLAGKNLHHSNVELRRALAYFLARAKEPKTSNLVKELLRDSDTWVRFYSLQAAVKLAQPDLVPSLLPLVIDTDSWNRIAALQALKACKGENELWKQFPPLAAKEASLFQFRSQYLQAIEAAKDFGEAELNLFLNDASAEVRGQATAIALKKYPERRKELFERAMLDSSWITRQLAVQALSELKPYPENFAYIAFHDSHALVRSAALESITKLKSPFAKKYLERSTKSNSLAERGTVVTVLLERDDPERLTWAKEIFKQSSNRKWTELRESLVDLFVSINSEEALEQIKKLAADPITSVALKAQKSLKEKGVTSLPFAAAKHKQTKTPYINLKFSRNPHLLWKTSKGDFEVELFSKEAPIHVANILGTARARKYDHLAWHRVVAGFVIQGGDPDGSGWGDAGYSLRAEINSLPFERGSLGMPRSNGFDTGGVQVFFNHVPTPNLDGLYTVFGKIIRGLEVIDTIEMGDLIWSVREIK